MNKIAVAEELVRVAKILIADEAEARTYIKRMEDLKDELKRFDSRMAERIRVHKDMLATNRDFNLYTQDKNKKIYDIIRKIGSAREDFEEND